MGKIQKVYLLPLMLCSIPMPLLAQSGNEGLTLEEVIVTATRREENIQEVAMSVSAFGSDFLQDGGINDIKALAEYTPNLKIVPSFSTRNTSIRIRGIGSAGTNSGIDPSVGIFLDGIYQGRAGMSIGDLVDVERVEVLRGPQGTLYGKNTAAGAISVVTKKPASEFESLTEINYDTNELLELRGMVNTPVGSSGHAARLSGFVVDGDHLFENTYTGKGVNDASKWGGRGRFLFDGSGDDGSAGVGEFIVTLDYTKEDKECCALAVIDYNGLSPLNSPATNTPSAEWQAMLGLNQFGQQILKYTSMEDSEGFSPPTPDPFGDDYWFDYKTDSDVEVGGIAVEWNRELADENSLTFINAWRFYESANNWDGDFSAYDAVRATTEVELDQYSSELRFATPGGQTFEGVTGLYAYYSEFDSVGRFEQRQQLVENAETYTILDPNTGFGIYLPLAFLFPDGSVNTDINLYTTTSYAAFGQLVWNLTDEFSATLGLRYTYEKKEREGTQRTEPVPIIPGTDIPLELPPIAGPDIDYDDKRSDTALSPSFNLRYFFNPDVMGYASVSRGFKSGGYDQRRLAEGESGEFDEEIATNYELGWKSTWGNRRLQFNGTLFYVDYEDFQSQTFDGAQVRVTNAGDMRSYGAELELVFIPVAHMTMGTSIGYNKAEYQEFDNGQCTTEQVFHQFYIVEGAHAGSPGTASICTQDLAGKPLDNAPEWTASSFYQHDAELGNNLMLMTRLEHSYTDSYYLDQDLDENLKSDETHLINLRLTLSNQARDWEVSLWGRNMLDEEYYFYGIDIPTLGGYAGVPGTQATYGLTLRLYN